MSGNEVTTLLLIELSLHKVITLKIAELFALCIMTHFRGVILYAMVCGRLPFGDDCQIRSVRMTTREITYVRPISLGELLIVML